MTNIEILKEENEYLKKVLNFYADCFNYMKNNDKMFSNIETDSGNRARKALSITENNETGIDFYILNELNNYENNKSIC